MADCLEIKRSMAPFASKGTSFQGSLDAVIKDVKTGMGSIRPSTIRPNEAFNGKRSHALREPLAPGEHQ